MSARIRWRRIPELPGEFGQDGVEFRVIVSNEGSDGIVAVDGLQLVWLASRD